MIYFKKALALILLISIFPFIFGVVFYFGEDFGFWFGAIVGLLCDAFFAIAMLFAKLLMYLTD